MNITDNAIDVHGASTADDNTPWEHYNNRALAEIWIGREAVNVGDLTQSNLYQQIWAKLDKVCPGSKHGFCYDSTKHAFATHYVTESNGAFPIRYGETNFFMEVDNFRWHYEETRRLLIGAAAGTLEALTRNGSPNCYSLPLHGKHFCNIGDDLKINLPDQDNHNNFIHLRFYGDQVYGGFRCCRDNGSQKVRGDVDKAIDGLGPEFSQEFGRPWSRLTMCILHGWRTCEECGAPCDSCGTSCPAS
ncbi:hypothetical protein T440DRAFT_542622 [Plenodomus tracheiphilus IPT5]|uniref:Uncharacterized protein n=1 Tax=Plenodomus tracheiphilus IPT5 TaxID=1408161 RepID=A0A6A7AVR8_9PLEO|nr:hypothetical protein T440DRAFT_542622 [Plenodomus tracheiphilus IPT5]